MKNSALLRQAVAGGSEVFVTVDGNLEYQQRLPDIALAIVALQACSNDVVDLEPLMPELLASLPTLSLGRVTHIPA